MISFHIVNYLHNRAVFFWHTIQNKRIAMFDNWIPLPVRMVFGREIIEYRMLGICLLYTSDAADD